MPSESARCRTRIAIAGMFLSERRENALSPSLPAELNGDRLVTDARENEQAPFVSS
jgi:hypothetical protein